MKPGPIAPSSREKANSHTLRAARTRQRIVDAVRSFVDEGNAQPTAKQIAQRAGVCLRTVFNSGPTELRIEALTDDHIKRFADQLRRMTDRDLVMALLSGELPKGLNGSNSPAAEPDKEELRR